MVPHTQRAAQSRARCVRRGACCLLRAAPGAQCDGCDGRGAGFVPSQPPRSAQHAAQPPATSPSPWDLLTLDAGVVPQVRRAAWKPCPPLPGATRVGRMVSHQLAVAGAGAGAQPIAATLRVSMHQCRSPDQGSSPFSVLAHWDGDPVTGFTSGWAGGSVSAGRGRETGRVTRPAGTESMGSGARPWRWAPAWVISSAGQQGAVGAQCPARPGTDGPLQASYERAPTSSSVHPSGLCPRLGRAGKGWTVPAQQRQHSSGKREGGRNPSRRARRARAASAFWRVSWNQARSREMGPAYPSRQGLDAGTEEGTAECGRSSDRRRRLLECEGPPFLALGVAPERHGGVTVWLRWCDCAPTGDTLPSASGGLRRWRRRGSSYRRQQRWWLRGRGTGYLAYLRGAHARGGRRLATGCGMKARRRRGHAERRPAFRPFCRGRVDDCPVQKRPGAARAQG